MAVQSLPGKEPSKSNSQYKFIKVNSLDYSIAFKIFIKCISAVETYHWCFPTELKSENTDNVTFLFLWFLGSERRQLNFASIYFVSYLYRSDWK